jgi:hypothetical protein
MTKSPYYASPTKIRQIVKSMGLAHAETVLLNAESQLGRDAMANTRAEFERLTAEFYTEA